jgi:putative hemolysin
VTIEDILEEIVGDIQDEYDTEEPEAQELPDNAGYIFDAGIDIDDVNDMLHVELPTDQSDTLGGFIYDQIGEVPEKGATVQFARLLFKVLEVNDRRILKVEVTHEPEESAQSDGDANGVKTQDKDAAEHPANGRSSSGRANGRIANT